MSGWDFVILLGLFVLILYILLKYIIIEDDYYDGGGPW